MASVTPGYDDRLLADRPTHVVVDRADGGVYEAQWSAAIDMAADWVMVTSWNEWFENTEIEPSERYGIALSRSDAKLGVDLQSFELARQLAYSPSVT